MALDGLEGFVADGVLQLAGILCGSFGYFTGVIVKLPGYKAGAKLQLVKGLSAKGVGFGVTNNNIVHLW